MTLEGSRDPRPHPQATGLGKPVFDHDAANYRFVETTIATVFNVTTDELRAPTRSTADIALARQAAMYVMHVVFGWTLTNVGRRFGRDRTTAGHACRRIEDQRDDPVFDMTLAAIERAAAACHLAARSRWEISR